MKKILVIDDDYEMTRPFLLMWGDGKGIEFFWAANSNEGIRQIKASPIDAILMDGNLINEYGHEVVSRIRGMGILTPIVMFSSSSKQNELGVRAGANGLVNKNEFVSSESMGKGGAADVLADFLLIAK